MLSGLSRVIAATLLVAAGIGPAAAADKKIVWEWAIYGPERALTKPIEYVAKYLQEKTNGNFTFNLHYAESISPAKAILDGLKIDAFQGGLETFSYSPGKTPLHTAIDLPFLPHKNIATYIKTLEAYDAWEPVAKEAKTWNAKVLYIAAVPPYEFMGRGKPPTTLEDWKGMRVRALGPGGDAMRVLGAVPTTVPAPETYTALERGTFDAAALPFTYALGVYRLHEVSEWYTLGMGLQETHNTWIVSNSAYEALPAEYKQLLEDVRQKQYEILLNAYVEEDKKWLPIFDKTLKRITFTPEMRESFAERAGRPIWNRWAADLDAKGLPGTKALNYLLDTIKKANAAEQG